MPVLIEARGLTEQTAAEKTHGLQSATRDRVLGNVRKAEEGMQAHCAGGLKRVYAVPFIVQRTFKSPAPSEQEGEHRGRPSSKSGGVV